MAVTLLAIALSTYAGMRRALREQLDRSLYTTFELQSLALARDGRLLAVPASVGEEQFAQGINRLIVVRDSSGRIIQANRDLARDLALDSAGFTLALAGRRSAWDASLREQEVRSVYGAAPPGVPPAAVLQVAASVEPVEVATRNLLILMIAVALLGSLACLVGASWLARSALAPVEDIVTQAEAVQGTGERITAHADVSELRGLIEVLNRMLGRLERTHEWHRRIIRDLGHDLRTPITTMRAEVEMALWSERRPDEYRRALASTLEEIDRLALISDAMSLLAKLESGDLASVPAVADVRLITAQAVDRARTRVGGHGVQFLSPATPTPARVDARLIGMALDQLLDNARRHTPPGTQVDVAVGMLNEHVTLTVEDHGPGVPDEMMPHLFSRFYRGDTARGRQAGFGLGLTLAAAIVDLHRGRIAADRGPAGGLRITIELPTQPAPGPPSPPSEPGRAG
jgi:signal transduction histidine kinase